VYYILQYLCFDVRRDIVLNILLHCIVLYIFSYYEPVFSLKMITCSWLSPIDKVVFRLDLHSFNSHYVIVTNINKSYTRDIVVAVGAPSPLLWCHCTSHTVWTKTEQTEHSEVYLFIYNLFNHTASTSDYMVSNGSTEIMCKEVAWPYWGNLPAIF
jgi:hypothetical protein